MKRIPALCLALSLLFVFACGKKTAPTLKLFEKPDTPASLNAIHREDKIILSWSYGKKDNLKGFQILRAEDNDFHKLAFIDAGKSSYIDSDFKTDARYRYKVIAQSKKNILSEESNTIEVQPKPLPSPPKNIIYKAGNNDLVISWESSGEGILYNVYKSYKQGEYGIAPLNKSPIETPSYSDNIETTRTVYYTLRALLNTTYRNEGYASEEIIVNPADFIPSKPEGLKAVVSDDKVVIYWKENPELWVQKYKVYKKTKSGTDFAYVEESNTPAFTDREKTGEKVSYRVTAVGPFKESEPSNAVSADF